MEGTLMIKSYRGLVEDGGQDKVRLTTTDGRMGYRIVKFQMMSQNPGTTDYAHIMKIFTTNQDAVVEAINFTDPDLLAAGYIEGRGYLGTSPVVIFENEVFNQDIYITHFDAKGAFACNYYIELEQINLTAIQAEVLIVKSLRGEVWTRP